MPAYEPAQKNLRLPVLADLIPRGDGSYILRPLALAPEDLDTWLSVKQAASILRVSARTVTRWLGIYLVYRRPGVSKYEVSLRSVLALKAATNDPEFWESPSVQRRIKAAVRDGMAALVERSLGPHAPAAQTPPPQRPIVCPELGKPCPFGALAAQNRAAQSR